MRRPRWWWLAAISVAFVIGGDARQAIAQQPHAELAQIAAEQAELLRDLGARYDRLQRRVERMDQSHAQADGQIGTQLRALEINWHVNAENTAMDSAEASGGIKRVETQSKPSHQFHGRMFYDQIMYNNIPAAGAVRSNETGFDTIRFGVQGNIFENLKYVVEMEFEGTETDYKDVFMQWINLPGVGNIRLGHFKEPIGLEENASSRHILFMERSQGNSVFVPSRNFGVEAYNHLNGNENITWFVGTFRHDTDDSPTGGGTTQDDNGDWVFSGRIAATPYYDEPSGGRYLVHVGASYSYRTDSTSIAFANRPELGRAGGYLSATDANDRTWQLVGLEAAISWGAASFQTEFYGADTGNSQFTGFYAQAAYFLTGEHRGYKRSYKVFDRVKPFENAFAVSTADGFCWGRGAWLAKVRYSYVNLTNAATGDLGEQNNVSAGFNWYMNPYTVMKFDYVHEDLDRSSGLAGTADNVGLRFQIDW